MTANQSTPTHTKPLPNTPPRSGFVQLSATERSLCRLQNHSLAIWNQQFLRFPSRTTDSDQVHPRDHKRTRSSDPDPAVETFAIEFSEHGIGPIQAIRENGGFLAFKAHPGEFKIIARNQLGEKAFSTPTICGDHIYSRVVEYDGDQRIEKLHCIGKTNKEN